PFPVVTAAACCGGARRALPVTTTAPRVACWPGASVQFTRSGSWAVLPGAAAVAAPLPVGFAPLTVGAGVRAGLGTGVRAGPGAGTAAWPAVNVIERPAALRMTSPADEAGTGGAAPVGVRVRLPCAGRGGGRFGAPG